MKKMNFVISTMFITTTMFFCGCTSMTSSSQSSDSKTLNVDNSSAETTSSTADSSSTEETFTKTELKKYNGQDGNLAYVAVDGIVYDVTNAKDWNNGKHQGYEAGQDLTDVISKAPHGISVLKDLPIVGKLVS